MTTRKSPSKPYHKHKCKECGTIWSHADDVADEDTDVVVAAHKCPNCDTQEDWKYYGKEKPDFYDHHLPAGEACSVLEEVKPVQSYGGAPS